VGSIVNWPLVAKKELSYYPRFAHHQIFLFIGLVARRGKARVPSELEYSPGDWIAPAASDLESHGSNEEA
jgi:hypothetical protein